MDTLVEAVHFPAGAKPELIAYRALAVNLSDLAAMGADPAGFTLALTLPAADQGWLENFSAGLKACAGQYQCPLLGGDITRGPLTITIQVHGLVDAGKAITRSGAVPGDYIYITGSLGVAAFAIRELLAVDNLGETERELCEAAFYRPLPRLALGSAAAMVVSAGIDISDGLLADLGHVCRQSGAGARLSLPAIPLATPLQKYLPLEEALALAVMGGDDYELLLTVSPAREEALLALGRTLDVPLHKIGEIISGEGVQCLDESGSVVEFPDSGYRHF
jgi:thiamine-monophosphate kinase